VRARAGRLGAWLALVVVALAACGPGGRERAEAHLAKGRALLAEGEHEAAVGELTRAVEAHADSLEGWTLLGNAYRGLKQYERAFEAYRAAKKIDRYVPAPHVENARALVETGRIEDAIEQLNHVIELDGRHREAMLLLGRVSLMPRPLPGGGTGVPRESVERAELNFETAVELAPDDVQAQADLARVRDRLGKADRARQAWTRVRELAGARPEHAPLAAEAARALGR
jgi:tetratricopeptide (TPR) repeat protein